MIRKVKSKVMASEMYSRMLVGIMGRNPLDCLTCAFCGIQVMSIVLQQKQYFEYKKANSLVIPSPVPLRVY